MTPLRNQAFALAVAAIGPAGAADLLRDRAGGSLKHLSEQQWRRIIVQLREDQSRREAPGCGATQWQRIQYLRRRLGWNDEHLLNYMMKIAKVDHPRFLDAAGARAMLAGLQKLSRRQAAGAPHEVAHEVG
jgi:hypothetical protein